ncbi:MAG: aldo/keto reductase [Myxococcales bacterium]|nr:aldo/keto reductase [Myxococcales bacterium]MCB9646629.1 aldo/keto reductase [Deltaproteobacteria bacterium]
MEYRFLGRTGVRVSRLAFGTMSFGGDADEATSGALYARCREAGINLFDCADVYAGGRSEEILGRLVKGHRDEVVLTSKAYFPTGKDVNARGSSRYHLVRAVEASLRRLRTDRVDLFFLHRFDEVTALEESLRAVEDLVRQGKVLYLGVSNFSAWQTMKALGIAARDGLSPLVCLQPMYNLVKRQAEVELLPMAQSEGLGVLPYSPLGGGLLSGKYGADRRPDAGRLVKNAMYKTRYAEPGYYEVAERFTAVAEAHGVHPAALAVAWVARTPGVTAPLIGARDLEQLEAVLGADRVEMTDPLYDEVGSLWPAPPPATDRNEERGPNNYGAR